MRAWRAVGHALALSGSMTWQILWALIFGFLLASVIQALVRNRAVERLLGDDRPRTLALAGVLGATSSSCSYAAVALARTLVRKGASFSAAMAFEIASTNLVIELGIVLAVLLGWQFTAAEFVGGPIMIVFVAVCFRFFVRKDVIEAARQQAARMVPGVMEGHAAMDMSISGAGSPLRRLRSRAALTSVSHVFVMEWAAVIRDVAIGLLVTGALAAWVPASFWRHFFFVGHPLIATITGPLLGPLVGVISFVCSVGNVPLAAVLWNQGISFGGVVAFVFADLIIIPILLIYRRYYGLRMTLRIAATFYAAMVGAGYVVELVFGGAGLVPANRRTAVMDNAVRWDATTVLDIISLVVAAALLVRFVRSGGMPMLREMGGDPPADGTNACAHDSAHHGAHTSHGPVADRP
jgi:uncharacterized membrane protein YraQ (UPF0718 family)